MAITFRSKLDSTRKVSAADVIEEVNKLSSTLDNQLAQFRHLNVKLARIRDCMRHIVDTHKILDKYNVQECTEAIDSLKMKKPNYSNYDAYAAIESVLEEASTKVSVAADTLVSTTRKYAEEVFNFHTSKFNEFKPIYKRIKYATALNTSLTASVIPHNDFVELYDSARAAVHSTEIPADLISKLEKCECPDTRNEMVVAFAKSVVETGMGSWLARHSLADIVMGQDVNERQGVIDVVASKRMSNLEHTMKIGESGWTLPNLKEAAKKVDSYSIATSVTGYYSLKDTYNRIIDFIDEVRRYSTAHAVKDPYLCTVLNLYSVLLIKQLSIIAVIIDKLHNTVVRLEQACQFGDRV